MQSINSNQVYYLILINVLYKRIKWKSILKKILDTSLSPKSKVTYYIFQDYEEAEANLIKRVTRHEIFGCILSVEGDRINKIKDNLDIERGLRSNIQIIDNILYSDQSTDFQNILNEEIELLTFRSKANLRYLLLSEEDKSKPVTLEDKLCYYSYFKSNFINKLFKVSHCILIEKLPSTIGIWFNSIDLSNLLGKDKETDNINYINIKIIDPYNYNSDAYISETGTFWIEDEDNNLENGFKLYIEKTSEKRFWYACQALTDVDITFYLLRTLIQNK